MQDGPTFLTSTDLGVVTTLKTESFGKIGRTYDGRNFTYVGFGGTTPFTAGMLIVAATTPANSTGLALAAAQPFVYSLLAGSVSINIVNGATPVTQDQFAEGSLDILGTNGLYTYKIRGNSAAAAGATITVYLSEPLRNILPLAVGVNTFNLGLSLYSGVIASTTPAAYVGYVVTPVPQTAAQSFYGWVHIRGRGFGINDAAAILTKGTTVQQSTTVAGAVVIVSGVASQQAGVVKETTAVSIGVPLYVNIY